MGERFFRDGVTEVDCTLVNNTGTIIRLRPSLTRVIPSAPATLELRLQGETIVGRLNPHPANPYIAGPAVRSWIRARVPERRTRQARLREIAPGVLEVLVEGPGFDEISDDSIPPSLRGKVRAMRAQRDRTRLKRAFRMWERDPGLRHWILRVWGPACQVEGCGSAREVPGELLAAVAEVHHLTHVSRGGSDDPLNLSVLCANHHRLIHRAGESEVEEEENGTVVVHLGKIDLRIVRDLGALTR